MTHTGIGQCANSKPHDIYRKSRYSPHTSDAQYAYVQYYLSLSLGIHPKNVFVESKAVHI